MLRSPLGFPSMRSRSTSPWRRPWPCTRWRLGWRAMTDLTGLREEAERAVREAAGTADLEELRVRYLGRKSELTATLRSIGELPPDQRGPVGKAANEVRVAVEELLTERTAELEASELDERL